jgi:hypothetical protein
MSSLHGQGASHGSARTTIEAGDRFPPPVLAHRPRQPDRPRVEHRPAARQAARRPGARSKHRRPPDDIWLGHSARRLIRLGWLLDLTWEASVFHFVTPRGRRVPSPGSALRATVLMLLAVIGCCIAACGGGSSTTASSPTAQAAQKQAAAVAQRRAAALRRKRAAALRKRRARARRIRAERRVRAAAKRRREEVARRAAAQRAASDGCPGGLVPEGTEACVLPGGQSAGCGDDPYSTPTRSGGCIGPAHPPSTGPATNCPPGEVPAGETGACAPAAAGYGDPRLARPPSNTHARDRMNG